MFSGLMITFKKIVTVIILPIGHLPRYGGIQGSDLIICFNSLGYNTYAVRVLSNVSTCSHHNDKGNVKDMQTGEKGGASKGGNIAVTIASVCAAVGLIVAAVIVCLKCRRVPPLVKKCPSK